MTNSKIEVSPDLMSVPEAAAFLRLQPSTVRAWILKRRIAHMKLGGRVFLRRVDLQEMLDQSLVPAETSALDCYKCAGTSPPAASPVVVPAEGRAQ